MSTKYKNTDEWRAAVSTALKELLLRKGDGVLDVAPAITAPAVKEKLAEIIEGAPLPVHFYRSAISEITEKVYPLRTSRDMNDRADYAKFKDLRREAPIDAANRNTPLTW